MRPGTAGKADEGADLTEQILVNPCFPDQIITIGGRLSPVCKSQLKTLLINNLDVFVGKILLDMTGVPRRIIEHSLNVNPSLEPFCQKRRTFSPEKSKVVTNEETLYAYLAVANEAVSAVLLTERNGRQCPVQRLRRYFEAHPVEGQVLADFLPDAPDGEAEEEYFRMPEVPPEVDDAEVWTLFTDGAASLKGSGAGLVLIGPSGLEYTYALRLTFVSTNNEAEYEALLAGLRIARKMKVSSIEVKVDSKLVANHINGAYEATKESMIKYLAKAKEFISEFKTFSWITCREKYNQKADNLSKLATVPFSHLTKEILVEVLNERSTDAKEVQTIVEEEGDNWMTPIINYLEEGIVPSDKMKHCKAITGPPCMLMLKNEVDKCDSAKIIPHSKNSPRHNDLHHGPLALLSMGNGHPRDMTQASGGAKFVIVAIGLFYLVVEAKALTIGAQLVNKPFKVVVQQIQDPQNQDLDREWKRAVVVDEYHMCYGITGLNQTKQCVEIPFQFNYGIEAVIPAEIGIPSYRTLMIREEYNKEEQRLNLDLLQERREATAIREAKYKTKMEQYYNKKVRPAGFRPGEFVYRRNEANRMEDEGKLGPNWDRPFRRYGKHLRMALNAADDGGQGLEERGQALTWKTPLEVVSFEMGYLPQPNWFRGIDNKSRTSLGASSHRRRGRIEVLGDLALAS
ncbi:reverse transcriptase domain-containing protein [Tanacetum coccineum]